MLTESRQRILSLVDSALLLTQIEVDGGKFQAGQLDLAEILALAAKRAAALAAARKVRIVLPYGEVGWTNGKPSKRSSMPSLTL